jgi:hypothetical protein
MANPSNQADKTKTSAVPEASPAPSGSTQPVPSAEVKWVKQFPLRLNAVAKWTKQFLHGRK